jgi:hypothetical protein
MKRNRLAAKRRSRNSPTHPRREFAMNPESPINESGNHRCNYEILADSDYGIRVFD